MFVAARHGMTSKHQQVVVAYDFSELGRVVLERAVALVSRAPFHILHFITVVDPHAGIGVLPHKGRRIDYTYADEVRDLVSEEVRKAFGSTPIPEEIHFYVHARIGKPAEEIVALAIDVGADLVMVGTHGYTGLERLVLGSTAERVVREAGCPVLVVRAKKHPDVELAPVVELQGHVLHRATPHRFSYSNSAVILRPPDWPIH
jgi:nucleotide-binding universal stress UspA family protein